MMRGAILMVLIVAASFEMVAIARAQEADVVTLDELLERVERAPRVRVQSALAEAFHGDVRAAGQHPNPTLSYEFAGIVGGIETNGGSQQEIRLSQPLMWPGQIDRRVDAARARLDLAHAELDALRAALGLEVRRAFIELLAAQERSVVLSEAEASMERLAEIVRGRAQAGAGRRWDVVRIEGELASVRAERDAASAEEAASAGRIAALLGVPGWFPRAGGKLSDFAIPDTELEERPSHPLLETARRGRVVAEARLAAERILAIPPIELSLGTVISTDPEGGYLLGGVSMPLPFFDANQGAIERAEREVDAAETTEDATRIELASALARARRVIAHRREALSAFERGVVERLPILGEMAEFAYRGGEVEVFEVIDAVRAARELRKERIDREEALRLAEVDAMEAATGESTMRARAQ